MSKTETIRARVEPEIKRRAESVLRELGPSPTEAIRMFYRQVILRRGLPFAVEIPNAETQAAMREAIAGENLSELSDLDLLKRARLIRRLRTTG